MLDFMQRRFRSAVHFPMRSDGYLRGMRISNHVVGVGALALALLWNGGWQTTVWALVGLGWFVQSSLAEKELRRRTDTTGR
ncbi:hypothetical protein SAMN04489743_1114 [Pseudarthrobacter equi]|uniref:Uncharacterized protein n=1 Tax=Pseudarthrobacter equi TaxID=728066 RepID=A0A1H1VU14_9MICC|nr:hypothetical protein SAMN04489743_1114 [Pseudarthrobacter equi]